MDRAAKRYRADLPAVHLPDVPELVLAALRERARRRGRSFEQELQEILQAAATEKVPRQEFEPLAVTTSRRTATSTWRRDEIDGDAGR